LIQFILALLPAGERINHLMQIINRSHSNDETLKNTANLAEKIRIIGEFVDLEGSTVVEVGTGWDAISAILFYLMGTRTCYTYDHLPHVRFKLVRKIVNQIEAHIDSIQPITSVPKSILTARLARLQGKNTLKELLAAGNINYQAPNDATQSGLPNNSVDLYYAYAVLEHVPENIVDAIIIEAKRVLKEQGRVYFAIGLHDHYAGFDANVSKINFLKYPEWLWSFFVKNKISYHNRLRGKQFLDLFKSHGARIEWINSKIDPADLEVLKTMKIDRRFDGMTHEELAVNYLELIFSF